MRPGLPGGGREQAMARLTRSYSQGRNGFLAGPDERAMRDAKSSRPPRAVRRPGLALWLQSVIDGQREKGSTGRIRPDLRQEQKSKGISTAGKGHRNGRAGGGAQAPRQLALYGHLESRPGGAIGHSVGEGRAGHGKAISRRTSPGGARLRRRSGFEAQPWDSGARARQASGRRRPASEERRASAINPIPPLAPTACGASRV